MTITNTSPTTGELACNGSVVDFNFSFKILDEDHLNVYLVTVATGAQTLLTKTTDYTVTLTGAAPSAGKITTVSTYSSAYSIVIDRNTEQTQEMDLENEGGWFPETQETAFDKLTMICQEISTRFSRAIQKVVSGDYWDFLNLPGKNLADPTDAQDVASKNYVDTQDASTYASALAAANAYTNNLVASLVAGGALLATTLNTTISNGATYLDVPYAVGTFTKGLVIVGGAIYDIATDITISDDGSGNIRMTFDAGAIIGDHNVIVVMFS